MTSPHDGGTGRQRPPCRPFRLLLLISPLILLALALAGACGDGDNGSDTEPTVTPGESNGATASPSGATESPTPRESILLPEQCGEGEPRFGLTADLELSGDDGQYEQGERITITLKVTNCGDNEANLFFPTTQRYDFSVQNEAGETVWSSSDGVTYEQVLGEEELQPGDSLEYEERWNQEDKNGQQTPPGRYRVLGFSVGCGDEARSDCKFGPVKQIDILE